MLAAGSINPGADKDAVQTRLLNVTDSAAVEFTPTHRMSGSNVQNFPPLHVVTELKAGKSYEIQVRDVNSSATLKQSRGYLTIRRAFR